MDGPVRKPSNRGLRKVIGKFPSAKSGRMVLSEGRLERDYITLLEFDPEITGYQEQPIIIRYRWWPNGDVRLVPDDETKEDRSKLPPGGKIARYYPDFYVERRSRPSMIVEVKNKRALGDEKVRRKLDAAKLLAKGRGWDLSVVTEDIREGPFLNNVRIVRRYSHVKVPVPIQIAIQQALAGQPHRPSIVDLAATLPADFRHSVAYVYALIHSGMLKADLLHQAIGGHSLVELGLG